MLKCISRFNVDSLIQALNNCKKKKNDFLLENNEH